ncbi:hypothetical protein [Enterovirga aerilata]|uniref:Uncharacterized protein n=1 Tax=Enterovirga aerilata TaxID=2730920 RepID=A0A849IBQ6_9HYPH|nr:hypothetical protein [Enterovirga sp. DB1703]NNM73849.1 hypothetical protein [Enterovirga sp. DB1703]
MIPEGRIRRLEDLKRSVAFLEEKRRHLDDDIVRLKVEIELVLRDDYRPSAPSVATAAIPEGPAAPARPLRSLAARLMLAALEEAGPAGLSGGELNKVVTDGGLTKDAAEKAKARVKANRLAIHNGKRWFSLAGAPPQLRAQTPTNAESSGS